MSEVYVDYNGTAPASQAHFEALMTIFKGEPLGNASSTHRCGRKMRLLRENARDAICISLGGVDAENIFFTSGATEANNTVLAGLKKQGRLIYTAGEHASIVKPIQARHLRSQEPVDCIPLTPEGTVDTDKLLAKVDTETALVSIMLVNNETGCINPIKNISEQIRKKNPTTHIHIDAVQGWGKIPLGFISQGCVDSLSLSGHKVGGLSGAGALYLKNPEQISSLILGGGHEHGFRAGTESMMSIVSMGLRAQDIEKNPKWLQHVIPIREKLANDLKNMGCKIWEGPNHTGNTIRVTCPNHPIEEVMLQLEMKKISASSGSACSSGTPTPSSTLLSMGATTWEASNSVRISFGEGSLDEHGSQISQAFKELLKP
ncbi:MAG: cysteine desulfurase family protein [Oligoflexales bacterium]